MTERPVSHEVATAVVAAALLAAGSVFPPAIGAVVAGVGVEVLGGLTERSWDRIRNWFLSEQVLTDVELQLAMRRAYIRAVNKLEQLWSATPPGIRTRRGSGDEQDAVQGLFRMLREDADRILRNDPLREIGGDADALRTLGDETSAQLAFNQYLDGYLHGHDDQLTTFIRRNLKPQLALSFAEELRAETPAGNRSWRAFQQLALNSLLASVSELRLEQGELITRLEAWRTALELRRAEERELTGNVGLDRLIAEAGDRIVSSLAEQFDRNQDEARGWYETTSDTVAREAEQTRSESSASHDLTRKAVRETEDRLSAEIQQSADQIRLDLRQLGVVERIDLVESVDGTKSTGGPPRRIFNVPHRPNRLLVGREELLTNLETHLRDSGPPPPIVALFGLGGVGKTQVAVTYAFRHEREFPLIWWLAASDPNALSAGFQALGRELELPEADAEEVVDTIAAVKNWLAQSPVPWLLIFDNADSEESIRPYLPDLGNGQIIVMSRSPFFGNLGVPLRVQTLTNEQGAEYLRRRTGSQDNAAAEVLAAELGGLPLALVQAGAYAKAKRVSFRRYLQIYGEHRLRLLEEGKPESDYPDSVATTWEVSFRDIEVNAPAAAELLKLCSSLAPDAIPLEIISEQRAVLPKSLSEALANDLTSTRMVGELVRYSLIEVIDDQTLSIHRLVQGVARSRMSQEEQRVWATAALTLVDVAFPFDCSEVSDWPLCQRLVAHALAVTSRILELQDAYDDASRLLSRVGIYLISRGQFEGARRVLAIALEINEATHGPEHPLVSINLTNLAEVLRVQNDNEGARRLLERALLILEAHPDADPLVKAKALNNFGLVLEHQGNVSQAQYQLEQAVALIEATLGNDHPDVAMALANLASVLHDKGDLDNARRLLERTLRIRQASLGPEHPMVAHSLNSLARVLSDQGDLDRAERLFARALTLAERAYGPNHPAVATCLNNVAGVLRDRGDLDGAERLFRRALAIDEQVYGPTHASVGGALNNLAGVLWRQGNLEAAKEQYHEAVAVLATSLGHGHEKTTAAVRGMAGVMHQQGDFTGAKWVLERHVTACEMTHGPDHPIVAHVLNILAGELVDQGDLVAARQQLQRAVAIHETALGSDHPGLAGLLKNLGKVSSEMGDCAVGRQILERALVFAETGLERRDELVALIREDLSSLTC